MRAESEMLSAKAEHEKDYSITLFRWHSAGHTTGGPGTDQTSPLVAAHFGGGARRKAALGGSRHMCDMCAMPGGAVRVSS